MMKKSTSNTKDSSIRKETKKLGSNLATYGKEKGKDTAAAVDRAFRTAQDKIKQLSDELKEKSKDSYDKLYDTYQSAKGKSADKAYEAHENILRHLEKMNKDLDDKIARSRQKHKES